MAESIVGILAAAGGVLAGMAVLSLVERVAPLRARGPLARVHTAPNLCFTLLTLFTYAMFNLAVMAVTSWQTQHGIGVLHALALPAPAALIVTLIALDLATYAAHRAMHASALLWRFHRVHHADPLVDVTTTLRQHPGESVVRFTFLAAGVVVLGASPAAFAIYRTWSAFNGMFEHANIRVPRRLDAALVYLFVTPHMHKLHHSRHAAQTDTNYGNLLSVFDRLFRTYTPSELGPTVDYGLAGFDDAREQGFAALLASPFAPLAAVRSQVTA